MYMNKGKVTTVQQRDLEGKIQDSSSTELWVIHSCALFLSLLNCIQWWPWAKSLLKSLLVTGLLSLSLRSYYYILPTKPSVLAALSSKPAFRFAHIPLEIVASFVQRLPFLQLGGLECLIFCAISSQGPTEKSSSHMLLSPPTQAVKFLDKTKRYHLQASNT